jgi:hypothetical protein
MTFPRIFTNTAAALLLAMATACFIINLSGPPHLVLPRDPISGLSLHYLFWTFAVFATLLGFLLLFANRPARVLPWVTWFAANFLIYRIALYFEGCHTLAGFLTTANYSFALPAQAAAFLLDAAFAYLFFGSSAALVCNWRHACRTPLIQQSTNPPIQSPTNPPIQ